MLRCGSLPERWDVTATSEVSPQHRIFLSDPVNELHFGNSGCLAAAKHLVDGRSIVQGRGGYVEYFHVLLDQHEVLNCSGALVESFHLAEQGEILLSDEDHAQIVSVLPELADGFDNYGPTARLVCRGFEAQILVSQLIGTASKTGMNRAGFSGR